MENDFIKGVEVMDKLLEHWQAMAVVVLEERQVEKECLRTDINIDVVKRIADSTSWSLRKSFEFCLREKEVNQRWPCQMIL